MNIFGVKNDFTKEAERLKYNVYLLI